jgi:hypothetical protein
MRTATIVRLGYDHFAMTAEDALALLKLAQRMTPVKTDYNPDDGDFAYPAPGLRPPAVRIENLPWRPAAPAEQEAA